MLLVVFQRKMTSEETFIEVVNRVSLPTFSDRKIMTVLFHFALTIRLSENRGNPIPLNYAQIWIDTRHSTFGLFPPVILY
jgi:hypothetical protein